MENPIKMDDLGVPLFSETPIYMIYVHLKCWGTNRFQFHHGYVFVNVYSLRRSSMMVFIDFGNLRPISSVHRASVMSWSFPCVFLSCGYTYVTIDMLEKSNFLKRIPSEISILEVDHSLVFF